MSASTATVPAAAKPQTLDELMLAMDVVDTIRHRELIVARELGQGARDLALRDRLREIYKSQGIEVTDRVIDEGIKALQESRFVYTPPGASLGRSLALFWINRGRIAGWAAAIAIVAALLWGGYYLGIERPRQLAAEQAAIAAEKERIELAQLPTTLPRRLDAAHDHIASLSTDAFVKLRAKTTRERALAAVERRDWNEAKQLTGDLEAFAALVAQSYTLRIASRPDVPTGVYRVPSLNESARNYYLIVEAIGDDGRPVAVPVTSEEDQSTRTVSIWGERVSRSVYERVKADKEDDGIIQDNIYARKARGADRISYRMGGPKRGRITEW